MKRKEIFSCLNNLSNVGNLKGVKLAYAVSKNKNKLEQEVKLIQEASKMDDKFVEYEKKRVKICEEHCNKDENDKPIIEGKNYVGLEDNEEFNTALDQLNEENKEIIEERKKQIEGYESFLDEEVELDIHKIKIEDVPDDVSVKEFESIKFMVEE